MASMMPTLDEGFVAASLRGNYAVARIGYGGQTQSAAIGVLRFDGAGSWTGSIVANVPGAMFGQRAQLVCTMDGAYSLHESGSGFGTTTGTLTAENGVSMPFDATFLVSRAEPREGVNQVQELWLMEDAADRLTGSVHMIQGFRHPDEGAFSLASFSGVYAGPGISRGGRTPASALGLGAVHFDGSGGFTGVDLQNLAESLFSERRTVTFDTEAAQYTVNPDGTGMIIAPGGQAHLVVTQAQVEGDVKVALEYFFVTNDLHPPTGNLVTTTVSKRLLGASPA